MILVQLNVSLGPGGSADFLESAHLLSSENTDKQTCNFMSDVHSVGTYSVWTCLSATLFSRNVPLMIHIDTHKHIQRMFFFSF